MAEEEVQSEKGGSVTTKTLEIQDGKWNVGNSDRKLEKNKRDYPKKRGKRTESEREIIGECV